jgi:hypothetical protein
LLLSVGYHAVLAEERRAAAEARVQDSTVQAQARLQQPFAALPAAVVTLPEVIRISADQQIDFEVSLHTATSSFGSKQAKESIEKQKKQAAAKPARWKQAR